MDLDQILPTVFVGSCPKYPADLDSLRADYGVTAVLNLQTDEDFGYWGIDWSLLAEYYQTTGLLLCRIPVRDLEPRDLRRNLIRCVKVLDQLLRDGHVVYVHCTAGINRSPSVLVAYLHWIVRVPLEDAAEFVMHRRHCDPYLDAIELATEDRELEA